MSTATSNCAPASLSCVAGKTYSSANILMLFHPSVFTAAGQFRPHHHPAYLVATCWGVQHVLLEGSIGLTSIRNLCKDLPTELHMRRRRCKSQVEQQNAQMALPAAPQQPVPRKSLMQYFLDHGVKKMSGTDGATELTDGSPCCSSAACASRLSATLDCADSACCCLRSSIAATEASMIPACPQSHSGCQSPCRAPKLTRCWECLSLGTTRLHIGYGAVTMPIRLTLTPETTLHFPGCCCS